MSELHRGGGGASPDEPELPSDDRVIGKAFRASIAALVVLAVVVLSLVFLLREKSQSPETVAQAPVAVLPEPVKAPAVQPPAVPFHDITALAGIDFVHVNGAYGDKLLPETMGGGVAFFDYDNDGDQDLLFVNSAYWPGHHPQGRPPPTIALFRNNGAGVFDNATAGAGLDVSLYGMGVAAGDYDNDGFVDLFITAVGENYLFHNDGGTFRDVTAAAKVAGDDGDWSTGSAFFDYDNDGDLDLFVANYVSWTKDIDFEIDFRLTGIGRAYGPPTSFAGSYPYLYRNEGDGSFTEVAAQSGLQVNNAATGLPMAKALGVGVVDVDADGWIDVFVANDTVRNFCFRNRGDGTFEEIGMSMGLAFDRNGSATGAMGSDAAYYRNDQDLGFAVGNFANEMTSLYVAQGDSMQFADEAIVEGLGPATRLALTFGLFFFDFDLDGRLDLFQANGHLEEEINVVQSSQHYAQSPQLFWNCGPECSTTFIKVAASQSGELNRALVGRGASFADIDADGDLDVVVTQVGRQPLLLRNDQALGHHWLRLKLVGKRVNRDGIGAWVELVAGDLVQRRQVMPTRSYLSQVELPLTFGLGMRSSIDSVRIRWPDGSQQLLTDVPLDTLLVVEQQAAQGPSQ